MRTGKLKATSKIIVSLKDISKSFDGSDSVLFEGVNLDLMRGSRTALLGDNGSGKTTLIKIIAGLETADEGTLSVSEDAVISYLPQAVNVFADEKAQFSIRELLAESISYKLYDIAMQQSGLEDSLASCEDADEKAELEAAIESLEYEFNAEEGWRVYEMLEDLKLEAYSLGTKIKELSGGEKTRLGLARAFLAEPDVLLLDEPTNCLDIDARAWLDAKLEKFPGAVLIITHDRYLLDHIVAETLEIDAHTKSVTSFRGNYQDYLERKKADYARKLASYRSEEAQLRSSLKKRQKATTKIHDYGEIKDRDKLSYGGKGERVNKRLSKAVRKLDRDIDTLAANRTAVPRKPVELTFALDASVGLSKRFALTFNKIKKSYDGKPILKNCSASIAFGELLAITGPNGAGKSTLLKILAGELQPDAGEIALGDGDIGYLDQEFESFDREQTVSDWLKKYPIDRTEAYKRLTQVGFNPRNVLPKQIMTLSYGQQRKLQLLDLIIRGCNVLLLDEPTNHMDLHSLEEFESVIREFPGAVIAITHDQYFIENVASQVLRLENGKLHRGDTPISSDTDSAENTEDYAAALPAPHPIPKVDSAEDHAVVEEKSRDDVNVQLGWNCLDIAIKLADKLGVRDIDPEQRAILARRELVQFTLANSDNSHYRRLLAPEIRHAAALTVTYMLIEEAENIEDASRAVELDDLFQVQKALDPDDTFNKALMDRQIDKLLSKKDSLQFPAGSLPKSLRTEELKHTVLNYLEAHKESNEALVSLRDRELQEYCEREEVYRTYVQDYYGEMGWFAFQRSYLGEINTSMIDIAAILLQKKIIIYDRKISGDVIFSTQAYFPDEMHIIFNGENHFHAPEDPELHCRSAFISTLRRNFLLFAPAGQHDHGPDEEKYIEFDQSASP